MGDRKRRRGYWVEKRLEEIKKRYLKKKKRGGGRLGEMEKGRVEEMEKERLKEIIKKRLRCKIEICFMKIVEIFISIWKV